MNLQPILPAGVCHIFMPHLLPQMVVIHRLAIGRVSQFPSLHLFQQQLKERSSAVLLQKNLLTPAGTVHRMVRGTGIFNGLTICRC
jgi:hypothetical protein